VLDGIITGGGNNIVIQQNFTLSGSTVLESASESNITVQGCASLSGTLLLSNMTDKFDAEGRYLLLSSPCIEGGFSSILVTDSANTLPYCLFEDKRYLQHFPLLLTPPLKALYLFL